MHDKAVVTSVNGQNIVVVPLITDACLSCQNGCAKRGKPFSVFNKKNLDVTPGSIVKIGASAFQQALQGIVALLFPVACAIAGYLCAPALAAHFHKDATDALQALLVLVFLALSGLVVFLFSRSNIHVSKSEIIEVY
jgi:hypothetical protein